MHHWGGGVEGGLQDNKVYQLSWQIHDPCEKFKKCFECHPFIKGMLWCNANTKNMNFRKAFLKSLAVLMGNIKQILCSDWLPHFACLRLPALFPCMKNVAWSRLTMVVTFGQCGQWSCKKQQKTIKTKTYTTRSPGFIVLQTQLPYFVALQLNKSFLILDKEKSFRYKIYLLLTKLV